MAKAASEPTVVHIADEQLPIQVEMADDDPKKPTRKTAPPTKTITRGKGQTLPPTTTEQEDRQAAAHGIREEAVKKGQRWINRLWEITQAILAVGVTFTTCFVLAYLTIMSVGKEFELSANALLLVGYLVVMATSIITSYFQRTNHVRQGGVAPDSETQPYRGR